MDIMIKDESMDNDGYYFSLVCGKKEAFIYYKKDGSYINVICKNATHEAFRGCGKYFHNGWDEVLKGYKSSEMRSMIEYVKNICQ